MYCTVTGSQSFVCILISLRTIIILQYSHMLKYGMLARFLNRKVLILDLKEFSISFSFEKLLSQVATLAAIVRKIRSIITIFGT